MRSEAKVNHQAVQSKTELLKRSTIAKEAEEHITRKNICSSRKVAAGRCDMQGHAENALRETSNSE